jgi:hypothetical protein
VPAVQANASCGTCQFKYWRCCNYRNRQAIRQNSCGDYCNGVCEPAGSYCAPG